MPRVITVGEARHLDVFDVTSITCTGCTRHPQHRIPPGTIQFIPGPGIDVVTFTNKAKDP